MTQPVQQIQPPADTGRPDALGTAGSGGQDARSTRGPDALVPSLELARDTGGPVPRLKGSVVAFEVGDDGAVMAAAMKKPLRQAAHPQLAVYASLDAFAGAIKSGHVRFGRLVACLPRQKFIIKTTRLPTRDEGEIRTMLDFELTGLLPVSEQQNVTAYVSGASAQPGYTDVWAAVTPNAVVEDYLAPLARQNIRVNRVIASPVAMLAWAQVLSRVEPYRSDVLMLLCQDTSIDAVSVHCGCLGLSRTLDCAGPEDMAAAAEDFARNFVMSACGDPTPVKVVLVGKAAGTLKQHLSATIENAPRLEIIADHSGCGGRNGHGAQVAGMSAGADPCASVARVCGAAAADCLGELASFNLVVESQRLAQTKRSIRRQLVSSIVLAAALLAIGVAAMEIRAVHQQWRLEDLQEEIAPIQKTAQTVAKKSQQLSVLGSQMSERTLPLAVLAEMYRIMPPGTFILELNIVGGDVRIRGQAQSPDQAYALPTTLMKSRLFTKVNFIGAFPVQRGGGTVTEFAIICQAAAPAATTQEASR